MSTKAKAIILTVTHLVCVATTAVVVYFVFIPGQKIVHVNRIVYRPVIRTYATLPKEDLIADLRHYDTDEPRLNADFVSKNKMRLTAGLYRRDWERDITIGQDKSGSWKYSVGFGVGGFVAGLATGILVDQLANKRRAGR